MVNLIFIFAKPHQESDEPAKAINETAYIPETEPPATMPAGYCIIVAKDNYDYNADWSVVYENNHDNIISMFQYSSIVKFENDWNFNVTMCDIYSLDIFIGGNNLFEHSGTFMGRMDVPAWSYKIIPENDKYCSEWTVYENINSIDYKEISRRAYDRNTENVEVVLKEGEYSVITILYARRKLIVST